MSATIRRHRRLCLILLLYLVLGVIYGRVLPLAESPDELDHFRYVQYLLMERRFPVMEPVATANFTMEANQPPLYYLLAAAVTAWTGSHEPVDFPLNACYTFDPYDNGRRTFYRHTAVEQFPYQGPFLAFHLARLLSTLLGAGTIVVAYMLGRQLAPGDERLGLGAAALLAFNPQFIFITATVNNDVLTAFLGAAIVFLIVRVATRRVQNEGHYGRFFNPDSRPFLALGILLGLGLLTKFALLALWPLALLAAVWGVARMRVASGEGRASRAKPQPGKLATWQARKLLPRLLALVFIPIVAAGWWYGRAYQLYGDPLAWAVHLEAKGDQVLRQAPLTASDLVQFAVIHFQSYWLWFGWLKVKAPDWLYLVLALMVATATMGLVKLVIGYLLWVRRHNPLPIANNQLPTSVTALLFNVLAVVAIYTSLLRYIVTINWSGYQGRLAFAVAAPLAVLLAAGLWAMAGPRLVKGVGVALLALATITIPWLLVPAYPRPAIYQPTSFEELSRTGELPALASGQSHPAGNATFTFFETCARFEAGIELEAVVTETSVPPGGQLSVTLYGYGLATAAEAQTAVVQISGRDGVVVGEAQAVWRWQAGEVVSTTLLVPVAVGAQPARALVQAGLQGAAGQWQTAATPSGLPLSGPLGLATVKIPPVEPVVERPAVARYTEFGDSLALLGYDVAQVGAAVHLKLYWQALAPMAEDYTVFVHLLDAGDNLLDQRDGQPDGGAYPTSIWDRGEVVVEELFLPLPPVSWQLAIGVYRLETLARLPARDGAGRQLPGDRLLLTPPLEEAP
jgi:hypothetical protein